MPNVLAAKEYYRDTIYIFFSTVNTCHTIYPALTHDKHKSVEPHKCFRRYPAPLPITSTTPQALARRTVDKSDN